MSSRWRNRLGWLRDVKTTQALSVRPAAQATGAGPVSAIRGGTAHVMDVKPDGTL